MAHYERIPRGQSNVGEVGIVRREIEKKRRHLPLRRLLKEAGRAVQAIKPVFMMSPISIAQYLEPGAIDFDLLLIDEASQVRPVDALGAIARSRQIVVVGDNRQLPPTQFFNRMLDDEEMDMDNACAFQAGDVESILGMCVGQKMPERMLRWHYRSRHHSLIAVSNHAFYDDGLYIVPSPESQSLRLGLHLQHVSDGTFDRGGSATNRREANLVAAMVMEHARRYPDKTLGVGTFSLAQRDAILNELELRRRGESELEYYFSASVREPFFVKNLENIQGDERDVIFISVGYGKDPSGYMAMSFGPLANDGGERRLNVLITRARERCEVFSSILADDIDLNRAKSRGVRALKTFLSYANSGILDVGELSGKDYDSEFERQVAKRLMQHGYKIDCQVGVAGFFIDLAVVDPECPGRYLLGIECDGATYHSSRSARDRDRLRQQVLEDRGWVIHRIWSTDWFRQPDEQLRKTLAAIEDAKAKWAKYCYSEDIVLQKEDPPAQSETIQRDDVDSRSVEHGQSMETQPYIEAMFSVPVIWPIHEVAIHELSEIVAKVVEIEGPIHRDEVARRVAFLWGVKRTGRRIAEAVEQALGQAEHEGKVLRGGLFYSFSGQRAVVVRNRETVYSNTLRQPEMLPPVEIRSSLVAVVADHCGVSFDEAIVLSARLFGFHATGTQLRNVISQEINCLLDNAMIEHRNGRLYALPEGTIAAPIEVLSS